jgi:phosphate ABC transporter permease protein PstC
VEAGSATVSGGRSVLERSPLSRLPDRALQWGLTGLAVAILVLIAYFFVRLIGNSTDVFNHTGVFSFVFKNDWDPSRAIYGGWPLVLGTLITSAIALVIGIPVAVAGAIYINELCPRRARPVLAMLLDLLAAVPSVVYGLWGVFVLIPHLKGFQQSLANAFSFLPFVGGSVAGPSYFIAGLILAIMILPIVSAVSREVIATVPAEQKEAALALGATRWEMIRIAVLPYSRSGITGAAMLGLGRAIGETIAVVLVIGNALTVGHSIFQQGYSLAAVIANEFGEAAADPLHRSALFAAGLVLFVLTLLVNIVARRYVIRSAKRSAHGGGDAVVGAQAATVGGGVTQ